MYFVRPRESSSVAAAKHTARLVKREAQVRGLQEALARGKAKSAAGP